MQQLSYEDRTRNPFVANVELDAAQLRIGQRRMGVAELHAPAIADAYRRGSWLGGGGAERLLSEIPEGPGVVPVVRITGAVLPVKVRRAAEFARCLGELAVWLSGGPESLAAIVGQAEAEGVPLWITRRQAPGPLGPITVTVERRLVRADVWGPRAPTVRLRGPYGLVAGRDAATRLTVTVGESPANLWVTQAARRSRRLVAVQAPQGRWELWRQDARSSRLLRDGREVALLIRPAPGAGRNLVVLPLADVRLAGGDPLDAVMAHFFAVCFGLGDGTGQVRFGSRRAQPHPSSPDVWSQPWFTGLGQSGCDSGPGAGGDGWGGDGGGGDGGGGGGDGGGGGGGDGGGGGGGGS